MRDDEDRTVKADDNAARGLVNGVILALLVWAVIFGFAYAWVHVS